MSQSSFIPALRFHALTPLFDTVAALTARDAVIKRRVLRHAAIRAAERVLDVGCGTGTLAIAAARAARGVKVTGLDADPTILDRARRKAHRDDVEVRFDESSATTMPYADASFDLALSTLFFHHLPDEAKRQAARELSRVVRPGGRVVIADLGRPHDPLMRLAVRATVQLLDGTETTALNVRGDLPGILSAGGLEQVKVPERVRTPTGSYEIITAARV